MVRCGDGSGFSNHTLRRTSRSSCGTRRQEEANRARSGCAVVVKGSVRCRSFTASRSRGRHDHEGRPRQSSSGDRRHGSLVHYGLTSSDIVDTHVWALRRCCRSAGRGDALIATVIDIDRLIATQCDRGKHGIHATDEVGRRVVGYTVDRERENGAARRQSWCKPPWLLHVLQHDPAWKRRGKGSSPTVPARRGSPRTAAEYLWPAPRRGDDGDDRGRARHLNEPSREVQEVSNPPEAPARSPKRNPISAETIAMSRACEAPPGGMKTCLVARAVYRRYVERIVFQTAREGILRMRELQRLLSVCRFFRHRIAPIRPAWVLGQSAVLRVGAGWVGRTSLPNVQEICRSWARSECSAS